MRPITLIIASAALSLMSIAAQAQGADGFSIPGHDYDNFPAHSPQVCGNTCAGEPHCQGWTWTKPDSRCWLKNSSQVNLTPDPCCVSGRTEGMKQTDVRAEDNTDRPGSDYTSFETNAWQDCKAACLKEHQCSSWTFRKLDENDANGACWLKNRVARPAANNGFISGVKVRRPNL